MVQLRCPVTITISTSKGVFDNDKYEFLSILDETINHFKDSFYVAGCKTQNEKTLHADLLLAGIAQLITVLAFFSCLKFCFLYAPREVYDHVVFAILSSKKTTYYFSFNFL